MSEKSFNRLPDIFKLDTPNNKKLYKLLNGGYEHHLEVLNDIKESKDIDKAFGYTLDLHGKNVQEFRQPDMEDDLFRQHIKIKILANRSKGDIETLNLIGNFLLNEDFLAIKETWHNDLYKDIAGIILEIKPNFDSLPNVIDRAKAAGIKLFFETWYKPENIIIEENHFIGKAKYQLSGRTKTESKKVNSNSEEILISDNYFKNIVKYKKSGRVKTKSVELGVSHENLSLNEKNHMGRVKYLKTGKAICGGGRL